MDFYTHNNRDLPEIETGGSSLMGLVDVSYATLVATFGAPTEADGYKIDWYWCVRFEDGVVATVYNWKDGPNYCGTDGLPAEQIREWHVGGFSRVALDRIAALLATPAVTPGMYFAHATAAARASKGAV